MVAPDLHRIVVAIDGSQYSKTAARVAATLAQGLGSDLIVLNVVDGRAYDKNPSNALKKSGQLADENVALASRFGVHVKGETVEPGESTVEQIINYAKNNRANLIVLGTRGLGGFKKMLLGSVSSGVVTHAECAVLVAR